MSYGRNDPPAGLMVVIGLIVVAMICAFGGFIVSAISNPDTGRTPEEIQLLQSDLDEDGFCAHEKQCLGDAKPGDCAPEDYTIHPDQIEDPPNGGVFYADGKDNDCDGQIDEGAVDADKDGDGYCAHETCWGDVKPGDCNDANPLIHPGAAEIHMKTDGRGYEIDNDCDGRLDNGTKYFDDDQDGFSEEQGDCNDENAAINPDAEEGEQLEIGIVGDGVDNNCDGQIDEGTISVDADGDGYCPHPSTCTDEEVKPGDCNDEDKLIHPDAAEIVDLDPMQVYADDEVDAAKQIGIDNDCDGKIDNNLATTDDDGDGFTEENGDCDDHNSLVYPDAPEGSRLQIEDGQSLIKGDTLDNNCNGLIDEGTPQGDGDGDGMTPEQGDCDDQNPLVYKGAPEWRDGYNNDCDALLDHEDTLSEIPEQPDVQVVFDVYHKSVYEARKDTWAIDHNQPIAYVDWEKGRIVAKFPAENLVAVMDRSGQTAHNNGSYKITSIDGPFMTIEHTWQDPENPRRKPKVNTYLLRFDERQRPVRVSLVINEVPRPGVRIATGLPIDGLSRGGPIATVNLTGSPAGIPALQLIEDDPGQTAVFVWVCEESCQKANYLGHVELATIMPKQIWSGTDAEVEVNGLKQVDLAMCRDAYNTATHALKTGSRNLEAFWRPVQTACYDNATGVDQHLRFIFTR